MSFCNFILYFNVLTNSLKFIKVYIFRKGLSQEIQSERDFHKKYNGNVNFSPKPKITKKKKKKKKKKNTFLPFFFRNRLPKI